MSSDDLYGHPSYVYTAEVHAPHERSTLLTPNSQRQTDYAAGIIWHCFSSFSQFLVAHIMALTQT